MKCRLCDVLIDQAEADKAAYAVGPGHETLCVACAESLREIEAEKVDRAAQEDAKYY